MSKEAIEMTDEQRLQMITEQLILVRDNLFRGMSKSIQKLQARSINEVLELPSHTESPPAQQEPVATLEDLEQEIYENTREFVSRNVMEWMLKRYYTSPPAQQEPVVFYRCNGCGHAYEQVHPTSCDCMEAGGFDRVEYYISPPAQRTWVGLTDEGIINVAKSIDIEFKDEGLEEQIDDILTFARAIEAKLKENT